MKLKGGSPVGFRYAIAIFFIVDFEKATQRLPVEAPVKTRRFEIKRSKPSGLEVRDSDFLYQGWSLKAPVNTSPPGEQLWARGGGAT